MIPLRLGVINRSFHPSGPLSVHFYLSLSLIQTKYHIHKNLGKTRHSIIKGTDVGWTWVERKTKPGDCCYTSSILQMLEIQKKQVKRWSQKIQGARVTNPGAAIRWFIRKLHFLSAFPIATLHFMPAEAGMWSHDWSAGSPREQVGPCMSTPERPPPGPSHQALHIASTWLIPVNKRWPGGTKTKTGRPPRTADDAKGAGKRGLRINQRRMLNMHN